mgnify:CR=1 FL=1
MSLADLVGFDYAQAIRELNQAFTYEAITKELGYESKNSIYQILNGRIPSHVHGEALWALYCDTFGHKPKFNTPKSTTKVINSPRSP